MSAPTHPLFARLLALAAGAPLAVAHRGDSRALPENTLPAFRSAQTLGVPVQEFDVRCTRDGALVCVHDATLDRTTDAATVLGPGALVAQCSLAELRRLDAGSWHPSRVKTTLPELAEALAVMLPGAVPLIEHKAGAPEAYVQELRRLCAQTSCILQSFDWRFVAACKRLCPDLAVAVLGPNPVFAAPDAAAVAAARELGAGMLHWRARALTGEDVARAQRGGLLVCSYTTDDEAGQRGLAAMGVDAICSNVPRHLQHLRAAGLLRRGATRPLPESAG
ncbi:MAG: hypothetical protein FJ265_13645 [Planctomycetes bacterium]|nr:hypothetical protein [Planctomycetota bacterium]